MKLYQLKLFALLSLIVSCLLSCTGPNIPAKGLGRDAPMDDAINAGRSPAEELQSKWRLNRMSCYHAKYDADITDLFPIALADGDNGLLVVSNTLGLLNSAGKLCPIISLPTGIRKSAVAKTATLGLALSDRVIVLDPYNGQKKEKVVRSRVTDLIFEPDGQALLIGTVEGSLYRWLFLQDKEADTVVKRAKYFERYAAHSTVISAVAYHPDTRVFFSGDWNGNLYAWLRYDADPFSGEYDKNIFAPRFFADKVSRVRASRGAADRIDHILVSPDGESLIVGLASGMVEVWSVRGFELAGSFLANKGIINSMILLPDGRIATLGRERELKIWKSDTKIDPVSRVKTVSFEVEKSIDAKGAKKIALAGSRIMGSDGRSVFDLM